MTREEGKEKFEGFVQPAQLKVSKITLVSMQGGLRNLNGWEEFSVRLAACSSALAWVRRGCGLGAEKR